MPNKKQYCQESMEMLLISCQVLGGLANDILGWCWSIKIFPDNIPPLFLPPQLRWKPDRNPRREYKQVPNMFLFTSGIYEMERKRIHVSEFFNFWLIIKLSTWIFWTKAVLYLRIFYDLNKVKTSWNLSRFSFRG